MHHINDEDDRVYAIHRPILQIPYITLNHPPLNFTLPPPDLYLGPQSTTASESKTERRDLLSHTTVS